MRSGIKRSAQFAMGFLAFLLDVLIDLFRWINSWFWELLFISVVLAAIIAGGIWLLGLINTSAPTDPCWRDKTSVECKFQKVEQCMKTEQYTKDQCVTLVGGGP